MEALPPIKTTQQAVSSPDGHHLAALCGRTLHIRQTSSLDIIRTIQLPRAPTDFLCLRWAPVIRGAGVSTRILLADVDEVKVWDLSDEQWSANIDNGSGTLGKITHVEYGSDDTEVLVFSRFGTQVTVWSLWTGRSIEIKDPKFTTGKGHGRSRLGRAGIFAILSRPVAQDVLTLHKAGSYAIMKQISLPTTDAQGLRWSQDGRWLAVWDASSMGYKILIFTADGHLYRSYVGDYFDHHLTGLGIKSIEWSPDGDFLAVGAYEDCTTLLSTRTFSPAMYLAHPPSVPFSACVLHLEHTSPHNNAISRSFALATKAVVLPPAILSKSHPNTTIPIGTSALAFNSTGTALATKNDARPTTVWVWDLSSLEACGILVFHNVVERISWHPVRPSILMIQCNNGDRSVYAWDLENSRQSPNILTLPCTDRTSAKFEACWIHPTSESPASALFSDPAEAAILRIPLNDVDIAQTTTKTHSTVLDPNDPIVHSEDDSLYEILSAKAQALVYEDNAHDPMSKTNGSATHEDAVEDTFRFRVKHRASVGA